MEPYRWDFDGSCRPSGGEPRAGQKTFSVGIFQWVYKVGRSKALKRSKVVSRVSGPVAQEQEVTATALSLVNKLNSGEMAPVALKLTYKV